MRILAIGAHPDDIEFGCGGTLIQHAAMGHEIYLAIISDGDRGGNAAVRHEEQARSAKVMGCKQVIWGGYPDTEVPRNRHLIDYLESVIREIDPGLIFVHYPDDSHQDHHNLGTSTVTAARQVRSVLFYEGPTTLGLSPTVFVDVTNVINEKMQCLREHSSQVMKTNIAKTCILDLARSTAQFRGIQARLAYAEGFVPLRVLLPMP